MNRGIGNRRRYPNVPQTHQMPASKISQQPPLEPNYVPTSEVKFYNPHSDSQVRASEAWTNSSFPPSVPPEQNHNPPPPTAQYWQHQPISAEQGPPNDPWKWTVDPSSPDVSNQYEQQQPTNFPMPTTWQQSSTPYQQPPETQLNQPYYQQPPPGAAFSTTHHSQLAPWNPTMDPNSYESGNGGQAQPPWTNEPHNNSHTQWQNFNNENSESQNVFWSYGAQPTQLPAPWLAGGYMQHPPESLPLQANNWYEPVVSETSSVAPEGSVVDSCYLPKSSDQSSYLPKSSDQSSYLSKSSDHDSYLPKNSDHDSYLAESSDRNVLYSGENIISSEHDVSCKNIDSFNIYSSNDTVENLGVGVNNTAEVRGNATYLLGNENVEEEYRSDSTISAFFNNDIQAPVESSAYSEVVSSDKREDNGSNSAAEVEAEVQGPCAMDNPVITDDECVGVEGNSSCKVSEENNAFIQNESISNLPSEVHSESASCLVGPTEDSPNQEVPAPSPSSNSSNKISCLVVASQQSRSLEDLEVTQEPPNQQVPLRSNGTASVPVVECETLKISQEETLPLNQQVPHVPHEPDRVVIRAREESPFKPPSKLLNSKGVVVQQEINALPTVSPSPSSDILPCTDQGVNMETVPDNLERPPDTEEQKKQSSWSTSLHRHNTRNIIGSSPSTSLWDSPDIPCVTLVPTDPALPSIIKQERPLQTSPFSKHLESDDARDDRTPFKSTATVNPIICSNEDQLNPKIQGLGEPALRNSESSVTPIAPTSLALEHTTAQPNPHYNIMSNSTVPQIQSFSEPKTGTSSSSSSLQGIISSSSDLRNMSASNLGTAYCDNLPFSADSEPVPLSSSVYRDSKHTDPEFESPRRHNGNTSYSSLEQFPPHSSSRLADARCASFDERNYYPEKNRSRPSSRTSYHGTGDEHLYHDRDNRRPGGPPFQDRVPSRMSESEVPRTDRNGRHPYYEQQQYYDERYAAYNRDNGYYDSARNYKGFEYDPYRQQRHPYYAYYDPYRYGYNSYNYGFYDELYRGDPRYKEQMEERYRQYYAKMGYETDQERSSVHSGRSSANELTKELPIRYAEPEGDSNESEYSLYNQQYYGYDEYSSKPSSADISAEQISTGPASRLTPAQFSCAHPICRFSSSGLLIAVIPTQSGSMQAAPIELHNIQVLMESTESFEELKQYQGPLIRGKTHKNDIIEFCLQKIKYFASKKDLPDRESYILLWELMVLLLRQNGSVAGSDIAELLLKDHELLRPASLLTKSNLETLQGDCALQDTGEHSSHAPSGDTSSPDEGIVVSHDKSILNTAAVADADKVTRKFREFLLFGHKKDALEWAMKHDLWGHALFLASKMDLRTYANVMTRFANSLALNDPLQTLYQLMSGRQPAAVTCVVDKKWGDWRPHLAMILSNPSAHTEVDLRSITTLGDTLANNGCLPAAHFCYLMAQVEFGTYSRKNSKMVLLSSSHLLPFDEFATNEAIQCTEIYEYAQSLANPGYMLPHLQAYKFIYATRLAEHGFLQEALHYCEILSYQFQQNVDLFSIGLIDEVLKLASKLKFQDPIFIQGQGELEEQVDPEWLQNLSYLLKNYKDGAVQSAGDYGDVLPNVPTEANIQEYNLESADDSTVQQVASEVDAQNQSYYGQPVQQSFYQPNSWSNQDSITQHQEPESYGAVSQPEVSPYQNDIATSHPWNANNDQPNSYEELEKSAEQGASPVVSPQNASFDYYGNSVQQGHVNKISRERTSSTSSIGTVGDRRNSTLSSGSGYGVRSPVPTNRTVPEEYKKPEKKEDKPKSQAGRAWLGGIFSKLIPRGPNQMILPDDKNPTIVWDSSKNCWTNTDGNEEEDVNQPLAPPTDTELLGNKGAVEPPNSSVQPPASSTSSTNRFQRPKIRGMRQNYVDIMNPGSTSSKPIPASDAFFPPPPPPPAPPQPQTSASNLFIPSVPVAEDQPVDFVSNNHASFNAPTSIENEDQCTETGSPLMFDPAEFDSRRNSISSMRHSVGPAGRRTYPT